MVLEGRVCCYRVQAHPEIPRNLVPFAGSTAAAPAAAEASSELDGNVTVCTTAEQLQAAVIAGQPHIEIRDHLNLTTLDFPGEFLRDGLLGKVPATVRSIRVRSLHLNRKEQGKSPSCIAHKISSLTRMDTQGTLAAVLLRYLSLIHI